MTASPQISLRELRERAEAMPLDIPDPIHASLVADDTLLALVDAVEAAQDVMSKPRFHWETPETLALLDALARFKDYA